MVIMVMYDRILIMGQWFTAALWGWLAGSSLLLGAALGYFLNLNEKVTSSVMAFGSGVLISALSFELIDKAYSQAGLPATAFGFLGGSIIYTVAARALNKRGAKHRKRSGKLQSKKEDEGSGTAIALGALLDGIPESIVIGLSLLSGKSVSLVVVVAIFISNIPEGLSSSAGMKNAGRSKAYIFGMWSGILFLSGLASLCGYAFFGNVSPEVIASVTAIAAGGILSMIVDTMIPEAFENERELTGIITVIGFLVAFTISKI